MLDTSEGFEDAYQAHSSSIYKFLFWRTRDAQVSEDLTSTTFEKAWISRKSFRGGSARAWLYRIARNTLFDYWRRHKELPTDDVSELQADDAVDPAETLDTQLQLEKLPGALAKLPKDMRQIITLRFIEGLPSKQVAQRLGVSDGNVRILQYRALKKLKEYMR